ncbi:hypothetical protein [Pseudomonas sp. 24 E 13]|uniref:DUF4760 domain-containing protein n=1 Tax=Pseudomonas orientalis TaxID=76758 RepID=A0A4Q7CSW0_9PSED|nr:MULTISPECIES: hypothetical protein [Pseudomonas]RZI18324.1 hypothetical protein EUX57_28325 [Pseudomonas orientalis]CRM18409.1 hypothetical protein [Pseudomonas sp. 24 E 13]
MVIAICIAAVVFGVFVVRKLRLGKYSDVSGISSLLTFLVAVAAAGVAYNQLNESRVAAAKSIYREYLSTALSHPKFSAASYPFNDPKFNSFKAGADLEQYENYVAYLIFSAEEVLEVDDLRAQRGWCETIRDQFKYHALYLSSPMANAMQYSEVVDKLIREGINMYLLEKEVDASNGSPAARIMLEQLRSDCQP